MYKRLSLHAVFNAIASLVSKEGDLSIRVTTLSIYKFVIGNTIYYYTIDSANGEEKAHWYIKGSNAIIHYRYIKVPGKPVILETSVIYDVRGSFTSRFTGI